MSADAPRLEVKTIEFFERATQFRLPFRFGAVTVTHAPQAFVRLRIATEDGRSADGVAAEMIVPKWFDKSPHLTHAENFAQLRRSLFIARDLFLAAGRNTAFGMSAAINEAQHRACAAEGLNGLIASYGIALHERAVIDALGRLFDRGADALVQKNALGITVDAFPELAGLDVDQFLGELRLAPSIAARHTVGLADALMSSDIQQGSRLGDGLPETLEAVIATYGHRYFKLKVSGHIEADVDRLARIADVLDRRGRDYKATLDGNEQYGSVDEVIELWRRIGEEPRLARLKSAILFVEQPISRSCALTAPVVALAEQVSMEIDESDSDMGAFVRARRLGYTGISAKSCKGFYRALINRARVARWNAEDGEGRYFMSAEDLTTQPGVSVQQDLLLATLIGATHIERNGHHYVDGMGDAPIHEQRAFAAAHPALYHHEEGRTRLSINAGVLDLSSLAGIAGLGVGLMPDFHSMQPMSKE